MQIPDPGAAPRPLVIVNPSAGSGRTGRDLAHFLAGIRGAVGEVDVAETKRRGDAAALAAAAARDRRPLVVGLGGDGTLDEIVNGMLGAPGDRQAAGGGPDAAALPALGIVGTGTGGDYGRSLGIPHELGAYFAALEGGAERAVDVGWARFPDHGGRPVERYWINVLSAGVGGLVDRYTAAAPAFLPGKLAYGQATVRAIFTCRRVRLRLRYVDPEGERHEMAVHAHAVAVCNGRTFGGGMNIAPMAELDDGLLEVVVFQTRTRWRLVAPDEHRVQGDAHPGARRGPLHLPGAGDEAGGLAATAATSRPLPPRRGRRRARRRPRDRRRGARGAARARASVRCGLTASGARSRRLLAEDEAALAERPQTGVHNPLVVADTPAVFYLLEGSLQADGRPVGPVRRHGLHHVGHGHDTRAPCRE